MTRVRKTFGAYNFAGANNPSKSYVPDPANGFEYIDLGLPSGNLWATCNIGASSPEEYGKFFQWGDIVGYTDTSHSTWATAPFNGGFTSYNSDYWDSIDDSVLDTSNTTDYILNSSYDAVEKLFGENYKIPSKTELDLLGNTTIKEDALNGIKGIRFTSKIDITKSIFIPYSGYIVDNVLKGVDICAYLQSSSVSNFGNNYTLYIGYGMIMMNSSTENKIACPIRAIKIID